MDRQSHEARLQRLTLNVEDVAPLLGINRSTAYELIRQNAFPLPVLKLGRRLVIPRKAVEDLLGDTSGGDAA